MEWDILEKSIMVICAKYDPKLDIAPNEFGRIFDIVESIRFGWERPDDTKLNKVLRDWDGEGSIRNIANRCMTCLAKAVLDKYGRYVTILPALGKYPDTPWISYRQGEEFEAAMIEKAKAGDNDAKIFYAIYKYFCAISQLSRGWPRVRRDKVLQYLNEANEILPSQLLDSAISDFNTLFDKTSDSKILSSTGKGFFRYGIKGPNISLALIFTSFIIGGAIAAHFWGKGEAFSASTLQEE